MNLLMKFTTIYQMILNLKLDIQQIIIGVYEITNQLAFSNFPLKCGCCFLFRP